MRCIPLSCFFYVNGGDRYLHVRTRSFPTRRAADLGRTPRPSATLWRVVRDPRYDEIAELAAPEKRTFEKASDKSPVTRSPSASGTAKFNAQLAQLNCEPPSTDRKSTRLNSSH